MTSKKIFLTSRLSRYEEKLGNESRSHLRSHFESRTKGTLDTSNLNYARHFALYTDREVRAASLVSICKLTFSKATPIRNRNVRSSVDQHRATYPRMFSILYAEISEISKILDREARVLSLEIRANFRSLDKKHESLDYVICYVCMYVYRRYSILESDRVFSGRELTRCLPRERSRACREPNRAEPGRAEPSRSIIRKEEDAGLGA